MNSKHHDTPFMSIVVITYNRAKTVSRAIESLLAQDYPKDAYEIIVVDDGSTDNTNVAVGSYPVRYVRLAHNSGIARARNAGLEAAKGSIYVAFDDDCIAEADWLTQLAKGYQLDNPVGVGGYIIDADLGKSLLKQYIGAQGSGPATISNAEAGAPSIRKRLWNYVLSGRRIFALQSPEYVQVTELYGANGSFPVDVLKAVGGWHASMSGIEDRDLSLRIHRHYPNRPFYAMRDAKIINNPTLSLGQYLLRPYRRGPVNLQFHRTHQISPPFFPFPIAYVISLVAVASVHPIFLPVAILLAPQLLYFWWPYYFLKHRKAVRLLFPYIQLAEESMVIVGLIRGYFWRIRKVYAKS